MPDTKYNRNILKRKWMTDKEMTIKGFFKKHNIWYNTYTKQKSCWWLKEKKKFWEIKTKQYENRIKDELDEQRMKVLKNLRKSKIKSINDLAIRLLNDFDRLSINDIKTIINLLKIELWEPTQIEKGEMDIGAKQVVFDVPKSWFIKDE